MKLYRQGDVLLVAVPPREAKRIRTGRDLREAGRVVLAHGEVTGHAHVVVPGLLTERRKGSVRFEEGLDQFAGQQILRVIGRAAELRHDEHSTIVLPRGTYRVVRQREYSPEEIRPVAD